MSTFILEYIWLDADQNLRSKTKVCNIKKSIESNYDNIPIWNFDGSSTNQADSSSSEVTLIPCAIFKDPFRKNNKFHVNYYKTTINYLVLCETYDSNDIPLKTNTRYIANNIFNKKLGEKPWFGLEQEYFIKKDGNVLGFDENVKQGQFYCGVGGNNAFGRDLVETHMEYCIYSGINISGINAEVAPGQWEFQVGPCEGIRAGDHLTIARYILLRLSEEFNYTIDFHPKPLKGDYNGSGCHTNYSTQNMREGQKGKDGFDYILEAVEKLAPKHEEHMEVYGSNNDERMTGEHETASYDNFNYNIANRGCSVRIGRETDINKKGYFEDRRPASNCDPYIVTSKIFETTCL